ncbi:MAG TPA: DUF1552 domain-containing protein [Phycisphaerae bacterium]|nr:DUF1552 domain-containing protein [Phycisphaerae bacterium]
MAGRWELPRRTFLRGLGAAIALPFLEVMEPAVRAAAAGAGGSSGVGVAGGASTAAAAFPKRMAFLYVPNGKNMVDWTPAAFGADFELPAILKPLAAFRRDFSVLTGFAHNQANALGDGGGDHARSAGTYLTAAHPRKTAGANIRAGISVDQVAAQAIGGETRFPSLELSCDKGQASGTCESGYSCAYQFNLAWKSETQPLTPEVDPQAVFERLFSTGGLTKEQRAQRDQYTASILDSALDDARSLQRNLGATDRRKLDEYLTSIREVEVRLQKNGKFDIPVPAADDEPIIPLDYNYEQHLRLMFDLMALAFQTDSTRISTFIMAHDGSNRPYPQIGVSDGHHDLSHHRNDEHKKALIAKINAFHTTQLAYFLNKLKSIKEGDGNLLDNSMICYGSAISDGNQHLHSNLPVLLAGRGGGTLTPGRHVKFDDGTPMANLYVSLLNRLGVSAKKFGDSSGRAEAISA